MRELGADEQGRISYQEFLRRRLALRPEIEALRAGKRRSSPHHTPEYLPTSSDNSLGKNYIFVQISATFPLGAIINLTAAEREAEISRKVTSAIYILAASPTL